MTIDIVITLLLTWKARERVRIWLITVALGVLFFGGEPLPVLL